MLLGDVFISRDVLALLMLIEHLYYLISKPRYVWPQLRKNLRVKPYSHEVDFEAVPLCGVVLQDTWNLRVLLTLSGPVQDLNFVLGP